VAPPPRAVSTVQRLAAGAADHPLLIAHATGFNAASYRPMAEALAPDFDVWAFDARGHGLTPAVTGEAVDWDRYGDDAETALDHLTAGSRVIGFGHSMGGAALLVAADRQPARFAGLVLFEPIVMPPAVREQVGSTGLAAGARKRRRRFDSRAAASANFASKPPMQAFDPAALRGYVDEGFRPVDPAAPDGPVELSCAPDHEADTFEASARHRLWERLAGIEVPVAVIVGRTDDGEMPAELAPQVAAELPAGELLRHPELDHFGPFVHPGAVAEIVRAAAAPWRCGPGTDRCAPT